MFSTAAHVKADTWVIIAVVLLMFIEGALLKWLNIPTWMSLVVRDGLAFSIIVSCWWQKRFWVMPKVYWALLAWSVLVVLWAVMQYFLRDHSPLVIVVGLRFWLLYLWMAVAAACCLDEGQWHYVIRFLATLAFICLPLAFLQSQLSPDHLLNSGLRSENVTVFFLTESLVRVSGPFAFTLGFACFAGLLLPFSLAGIWGRKPIFEYFTVNKAFLVTVLLMILFSGSRALIVWAFILGFVFILVDSLLGEATGKFKKFCFTLGMSAVLLSLGALFFYENISGYLQRFAAAANSEVFLSRVCVMMFGEPHIMNSFSLSGHGIGAASNAGGVLLSGERGFMLAETEPGRVLMEAGVLGVAWLLVKWSICIGFLVWAARCLYLYGHSFPLMLAASFCYAFITWPVSGQISAQVIAYLMLAFLISTYRYYHELEQRAKKQGVNVESFFYSRSV